MEGMYSATSLKESRFLGTGELSDSFLPLKKKGMVGYESEDQCPKPTCVPSYGSGRPELGFLTPHSHSEHPKLHLKPLPAGPNRDLRQK